VSRAARDRDAAINAGGAVREFEKGCAAFGEAARRIAPEAGDDAAKGGGDISIDLKVGPVKDDQTMTGEGGDSLAAGLDLELRVWHHADMRGLRQALLADGAEDALADEGVAREGAVAGEFQDAGAGFEKIALGGAADDAAEHGIGRAVALLAALHTHLAHLVGAGVAGVEREGIRERDGGIRRGVAEQEHIAVLLKGAVIPAQQRRGAAAGRRNKRDAGVSIGGGEAAAAVIVRAF